MGKSKKSELIEKYGKSAEEAERETNEGFKSLEEQVEELRNNEPQSKPNPTPNTDSDKLEAQIEHEFEAEADFHPQRDDHQKQQPVRMMY